MSFRAAVIRLHNAEQPLSVHHLPGMRMLPVTVSSAQIKSGLIVYPACSGQVMLHKCRRHWTSQSRCKGFLTSQSKGKGDLTSQSRCKGDLTSQSRCKGNLTSQSRCKGCVWYANQQQHCQHTQHMCHLGANQAAPLMMTDPVILFLLYHCLLSLLYKCYL